MANNYRIEFKTKANVTVFWIFNIGNLYDAFTMAFDELPTSFLYDDCDTAVIIDSNTNESVCSIDWSFAWNLCKC